MSRSSQISTEETTITHKVDFSTCYVTQRGRGVAVIRKGEMDPEKVFVPPSSWGDSWAWNVLEDGSGIYFCRQ